MSMNQPAPYDSLATRYAALQQQLKEAGAGCGVLDAGGREIRNAHHSPATLNQHPAPRTQHPLLIGVSKNHPAALMEEAIALGLREFGENKVQEAHAKWPALKARHPDIRLHLIGPLQSNKAADAVALFEVIHTIDRVKIADAIALEMAKQHCRPQLLIQVNIGEEPQKSGVTPQDTPELVAHCRRLNLPLIGLMCVPPAETNPAPYFALMKKMADSLSLPELSMGMSDDFPVAIRLGATMVRVGTALFGQRA